MATWTANVTNVDGSVSLYNLSDKNPFKVLSATGIGNAEVRRLEERGPFQEGVTDTGYRVDPRVITLVIQIYGSSASDADTQRDKLSNIFSPIANAPVRLLLTRDDGTQRQIDCYAVGMVDLPAELPTRILNSQRVAVQLKAPNPIWYDPIIRSASFTALGNNLEWWSGGGLIGTANVLTHRETVSQGQTDVITAGTPVTVLFRSARPTSGTSTAFDYRKFATNNPLFGLTSKGSVDFDYYRAGLPGGAATYAQSGGSVVVAQMDPDGLFRLLQSDGTVETELYNFPTAVSHYAGGTITWRQNAVSGSAWGNPMSHAATYNIVLSTQQRQAVVNLLSGTVVNIFNGTAINGGNWDEYPVITLTGPINDPSIENMATGEILELTGNLNAATQWVIDTRYGYKTITQGGSSIIDKLSDDSDLATFHLRPGVNPLRITASGGTASTTEIGVIYYNRYLSG